MDRVNNGHTPRRLAILDIWVDAVDMSLALERVKYFIEHGNRSHAVFAANPEKNFSVPHNHQLYEVFRKADLLLPDGMGIVLAARILHKTKISRIPGVEFMEAICRLCAEEGHGIFIYGAREHVNRAAARELVRRHPGLHIAGRANGYQKDDGMPGLIDHINVSEAKVLFLALGSPRQELWYMTHREKLKNVRVCQGIGGTLDILAGVAKRAPDLWRNMGLEWLYRLMMEPKRIRRQLVLPVFAIRVLTDKISLRHDVFPSTCQEKDKS